MAAATKTAIWLSSETDVVCPIHPKACGTFFVESAMPLPPTMPYLSVRRLVIDLKGASDIGASRMAYDKNGFDNLHASSPQRRWHATSQR